MWKRRHLFLLTPQAEECRITEGLQETLAIGEEYCVTVNAKNAGTGAVTCRIRSSSGKYVNYFHLNFAVFLVHKVDELQS